jgi:hypothetical protein
MILGLVFALALLMTGLLSHLRAQPIESPYIVARHYDDDMTACHFYRFRTDGTDSQCFNSQLTVEYFRFEPMFITDEGPVMAGGISGYGNLFNYTKDIVFLNWRGDFRGEVWNLNHDANLSIHPQTKLLAYVSTTDFQMQTLEYRLRPLDAAISYPLDLPLPPDEAFLLNFSGDGRWIFVIQSLGPDVRIWGRPTFGEDWQEMLIPGATLLPGARVSYEGSRVLLAMLPPDENLHELYAVDFPSGQRERLTDNHLYETGAYWFGEQDRAWVFGINQHQQRYLWAVDEPGRLYRLWKYSSLYLSANADGSCVIYENYPRERQRETYIERACQGEAASTLIPWEDDLDLRQATYAPVIDLSWRGERLLALCLGLLLLSSLAYRKFSD